MTEAKPNSRAALINLSVEEENLATLPFAVLERRVGKRISKLEVRGTKFLSNGGETEVLWQVQGNSELGLPTEQDLDIFVALGVLTFRNNFQKTVTFTGREIGRILGIANVHGKFYQRLKIAMDRFIPLRFRAVAANEHQEQIKWRNVFQEASFTLDRTTGRCTGTVTWTDKLIESMDSGFFRLLDASRYMELDGITAKHLYRFVATAFENTDMVLIDARRLACEHLGIFNPPRYLSRLMQTLEPPFEQLKRIGVLGSYHVAEAAEWRIALVRHPAYVPERKALLAAGPPRDVESQREYCQALLEEAGMPAKVAAQYAAGAARAEEFYWLDRAARLLQAMLSEGVLAHVALSTIRKALDQGVTEQGREALDWCEIAVEVCRQKKLSRQNLKNAGGLLVKIIKDPEARSRLVNSELEENLRQSFLRREKRALELRDQEKERERIFEYERFRHKMAQRLFDELPELRREALRQEKKAALQAHDRGRWMPAEALLREADDAILLDISRKDVPPYERWWMRQQAQHSLSLFEQ